MMNEEFKEIYSETIGLRLRPSMKKRLQHWANVNNLNPSVFARQIVLERLEKLEERIRGGGGKI